MFLAVEEFRNRMAEAARAFDFVEEEDAIERDAHDAALAEGKRILEALLFASTEPLDEGPAERMPDGLDVQEALAALRDDYATRGVNVARAGSKWYFRTADDLGWLLRREETQQQKLTRAAVETLAIIATISPSRAPKSRTSAASPFRGHARRAAGDRLDAPARPPQGRRSSDHPWHDRGFLVHFGLEQIADLPGLEELKGAGLFDGRLPAGFGVPKPDDSDALTADEDPLDDSAVDDFPLLARRPGRSGKAVVAEAPEQLDAPEALDDESQAFEEAEEPPNPPVTRPTTRADEDEPRRH